MTRRQNQPINFVGASEIMYWKASKKAGDPERCRKSAPAGQ